jgi:peptide/nickel transport system substrate-binding protein
MFKGYRGPVLALIGAILLLVIVLVTRPTTQGPILPTTVTPPPAILPTETPLPTLIPASPIPFQQLNTVSLHEAVVGCFKKLNPLLAGYNQPDLDATSLIFEGLTTTNQFGEAVPDLASSVVSSNDGLTYVVKLRNDIHWQDGLPFTSADVLFTIHLMQDPAFPGRADLHLFWQTVEVEALDDFTLRFQLAQPLAAFRDYLRIGILPEHALKGTTAARLLTHPFNLSPIGTGPYQFAGLIGTSNAITGLRLQLAAAYRQRPEGKDGYALQEIVFHCEPTFNDAVAAFQRGNVNSVSELPSDTLKQVAALTQLRPHTSYRPAFGAVIFNWQRDNDYLLRDLRMRQALTKSVDREKLVAKYMDGRAVSADSPIIPLSWVYQQGAACPGYNPKNPDAAKNLLSQVQVQSPAATQAATAPAQPSPASPTDFVFQLSVNNDPAMANMAQEIVKAWKGIGLNVQANVSDNKTLKERLTAGNFDAALIELDLSPSSDPDPYSLWRQVPANGGLNFGGMNDRLVSQLLEQARSEVNGVYRTELYHQFQQMFCDRAIALLLYYPVYVYGADSRLEGIQLGYISSPSDRFRSIKNWRYVQ